MLKSIFNGRKLYVLLHLLACGALFIIPIYLFNFEGKNNSFFIKSYYLTASINLAIFYINYLWLVPKFFFNGKLRIYILSLMLAITGLYFVNKYGHQSFFDSLMKDKSLRESFETLQKNKDIPKKLPESYHIFGFVLTSFLVTGFSVGLRVSQKWIQNEKEKKELEKEKLNSELAFLKNQINPHFFFNTLNNIYSLIQINTGNAQDAVLKLSKLMRYILYESEKGNTMLSNEIEFMNNYLDLMRLRLTDKIDLKVNFPSDYKDCSIQPLLFVSFIENAFKHGLSNREHSFIHIDLKVSETAIEFTCQNSIVASGSVKDEDSGIGLENIRKRLTLLYPDKHTIHIDHTKEIYGVNVKIETT